MKNGKRHGRNGHLRAMNGRASAAPSPSQATQDPSRRVPVNGSKISAIDKDLVRIKMVIAEAALELDRARTEFRQKLAEQQAAVNAMAAEKGIDLVNQRWTYQIDESAFIRTDVPAT